MTRILGFLAAAGLLLVPLAGCMTPAPGGDHAGHNMGTGGGEARLTTFDRSVAGLPSARPMEEVRLENGSTFALTASVVRHDAGGGKEIRMFAYNGQIPGPLLRVDAGSTVTVDFRNDLPLPSTVHWHGVRLAQRFDGAPGVSQKEVMLGQSFRYVVTFPDEGLFWYHPHVREDLAQELGLAGLIVVDRAGEEGPRELPIVLDDVLLRDGDVETFWKEAVNFALMGRYGSTFLTNGRPSHEAATSPGERVRLLVANVANARPFNVSVEGAASVELIALDGGFLRAPAPFGSVILGPAERATIDVVMPASGDVRLVHRGEGDARGLATLRVDASRPTLSDPGAPAAPHERAKASLSAAIARSGTPVNATWDLTVRLAHSMPGGHGSGAGHAVPIEWESETAMGMQMTDANVTWIIRDPALGKENHQLNYTVPEGSLWRVRIRNPADSPHPMQHPIHLHGQRFLVDTIDRRANPYPAWRDTVMVPAGSEVTITIEATNPGTWLFHCHISEHLEAGMEGMLTVTEAAG